MASDTFLRPRLIGPRFEDHSLPLEVLKDLAVLEELLIEVAKATYLASNPERHRTPRGFLDGVSLKLVSVESGSAVPLLEVRYESVFTVPPMVEEYLKMAREALIDALAAAEQNLSPINILPNKTLAYFNRLGRSLRSDESIEFQSPSRNKSASLNSSTRRRLLLASTNIKSITDEVTVRGTVPAVDQDIMTFELQFGDGQKIKSPLPDEHVDAILSAFNGYKNGERVAIKGIGRFSRSGKLQALESVEHVTSLEPLDVPARLDELRSLRHGWLEGHGLAPELSGLDWLASAFSANFPEDLPLPYTYPTERGGIRFEWPIQQMEASLDIDLTSHSAAWHMLNFATADEEELTLNLDDIDDWSRLSELVRRCKAGV